MTIWKRPGNRPSKVVLTSAIRADLKKRGFEESPGGTVMTRSIGDVRITIQEDGKCVITFDIPKRHYTIHFEVDEYWAPSILYIAQMELHRDAARIRQEAEEVTKLAEKVMDVVCGKTK